MSDHRTDILVSGGGLAGLTTTLRLAAEGFDVTCVDPGPRPDPDTANRERRTTAILHPGIATLGSAGVWADIEPSAQEMRGMRIVDCGGADHAPRSETFFDAQEIGDESFGWNIRNGAARVAMVERIDALENARLLCGVALDSFVTRDDAVLARLSDGQTLRAALLVGADGRDSAVRKLAGIGCRKWGYAQKALACHVSHSRPHGGVSVEMHHVGGPLTFAPLPGDRAGLVWMNAEREADRLAALDDAEFIEELNARSFGHYGEITEVSPRQLWPATTQVASDLTAKRVALVAEAAHAFPPIGAQGFNLSLRDIEALAKVCAGQSDPGGAAVLRSYSRARQPDIMARVAGVDLLNRSVRSELRPVRDLRRLGLSVIGNTPPLKRLVMGLGMGR